MPITADGIHRSEFRVFNVENMLFPHRLHHGKAGGIIARERCIRKCSGNGKESEQQQPRQHELPGGQRETFSVGGGV